jgi:hypothetical protein
VLLLLRWSLTLSLSLFEQKKVKRRDEEKQKEKNARRRKEARRLTFVGGVLLRALISLEFSLKKRRAKRDVLKP